jgi:hypothetical protein
MEDRSDRTQSIHYVKETAPGLAPSQPVLASSGIVTVPLKVPPNLSLAITFPSQEEHDRYARALQATLDRLASPPRWSTTPPTVTGHYFWRRDSLAEASCVLVVIDSHIGVPAVYEYDTHYPEELKDMGGEWWSERVQEPPR